MADQIKRRPNLFPLAAAAALFLGTVPLAVAQTTAPATSAAAGKADGSLQQSHDAWRATKLDGANVYNDQGNSIGTIDDMLVDSTGKVANVVLSVGGFLGMGTKYVEVPFSQLKFAPSKDNASNHEYSVVLPSATQDSLKAMTSFTY